jgi:hypothetical protein
MQLPGPQPLNEGTVLPWCNSLSHCVCDNPLCYETLDPTLKWGLYCPLETYSVMMLVSPIIQGSCSFLTGSQFKDRPVHLIGGYTLHVLEPYKSCLPWHLQQCERLT